MLGSIWSVFCGRLPLVIGAKVDSDTSNSSTLAISKRATIGIDNDLTCEVAGRLLLCSAELSLGLVSNGTSLKIHFQRTIKAIFSSFWQWTHARFVLGSAVGDRRGCLGAVLLLLL